MGIELTDDEIAILHDVFDGYGCDCPGGDTDKIQALAEKLGIWKPIEPPTEEELRLREEFKNSPFGKQIAELFKQSNKFLVAWVVKDIQFYKGAQWNIDDGVLNVNNEKIGSQLRIKLPNDYKVNNDEKS